VLPDLSVFWIILLVLVLTVVVNRLLFQPFLRVMAERERRVTAARELAEQSAARAHQALSEFETRTTAARAEVYAAMDTRRREALARREALLAETAAEASEQVSAAFGQLDETRREVRARLESDAAALGSAIAARLLDRRPS